MRQADIDALKTKLDFIQRLFVHGYTADEAKQLWDRFSAL